MPVETSTDVEEMGRVKDGEGGTAPPANASEQSKTNDRLGNFADGTDGSVSDDGTGSTLPEQPIPDGIAVTVQAQYSNVDRVAVGLSDPPAVELRAGQSIEYRVADLSQVRIEASTAGDGVAYTAEVA